MKVLRNSNFYRPLIRFLPQIVVGDGICPTYPTYRIVRRQVLIKVSTFFVLACPPRFRSIQLVAISLTLLLKKVLALTLFTCIFVMNEKNSITSQMPECTNSSVFTFCIQSLNLVSISVSIFRQTSILKFCILVPLDQRSFH